MEPITMIAVASAMSAVAAAGSMLVAALSLWRDQVQESRADIRAGLTPSSPGATKKVHVSVWNEGPGTAFGLSIEVLGGVGNENGSTESQYVTPNPGSLELASGSGVEALAVFRGNPGARALVRLKWREDAPLPPWPIRWLPHWRKRHTRAPRRQRVIGCETGLKV